MVRLLDADDCEVVGYLPEVEQRLNELEKSQEDGQQLGDRRDHEVSSFRDSHGSGKLIAWCQDSYCTLYHLYSW